MYATPSNNYWLVGDQPPDVRWSSAFVAYVADTDSNYTTWLSQGYETSEIATEQELADLLNATYPAGSPLPPPFVPVTGTGPLSVTVINGVVGSATTGQYTVPAGVHRLQIWGQAAGGGGGSCTAATAQVGGAGGSGETRTITLQVNPGDLIDYSIGAPGAASSNASDTIIGGSPSPVPTIASVASTGTTTTSTTLTVNLPAGITAGDMLLIAVRTINNTVITTPAGWSQLIKQTTGGCDLATFYKLSASGSEGATVSISCTIASDCFATALRIQGHDPATGPTATSALSGSANKTPNCPSLNATVLGLVNKLWLAIADAHQIVNGVPSGFTDFVISSLQGLVKSSWYGSSANILDPTAYSLSVASQWAAQTIAIKSAVPASIMTCKGGTGGSNAAGGSNGTTGGTPTGSGGVRIPTSDGIVAASGSIVTSQGGSNIFGTSLVRVAAQFINGSDGPGPGTGGTSGGNGAATGTARTGSNGGPGMIMIVGYG